MVRLGTVSRMPARRAGSFRYIAITLAVLIGAALALPPHALASRRHHARTDEDQTASPSAANSVPYVAACVIEPTTGTLIFEKNDHQPWPTASLTKMMVMLIVAEKLHDGSLKLADQVTTSRKAAEMGGSQVYLKEGETFSLDDSMKALVVHSANDSAVAIAEYVAGSTEAFVQMMNQRAAELGMKDTHYYSVHGLPPGRGQQADVASAYDQALLARELVKYPDILRWSSIDTAPFRNGTFELRNTNHLVRTYKGCDGLKTGFYDKAGFNVVATAHRGGMRLIVVVLGTPHKLTNFKEAAELMSQGFLDYEMRAVAAKGAPVKQTVAITGGAAASLTPVFAGDAAVFMKRSAAKNALQVVYNLPPSVAAPVSAGQQVGTANIVQDGKAVASVALIAPAEVGRQGSVLKRILGKL